MELECCCRKFTNSLSVVVVSFDVVAIKMLTNFLIRLSHSPGSP